MHYIIKRNKKELEAICKKYSVDIKEVLWRCRKNEFKQARSEIVCLLRYKYHYTYQILWDAFDGRDHSAILYLVKRCKPKKQFWWRIKLKSQVKSK